MGNIGSSKTKKGNHPGGDADYVNKERG